MIGLDVADLVVIASELLGCDTGTALAQADITAADDALAQAGVVGKPRSSGGAPAHAPGEVRGAGPRGASPHRADAAEVAVALMDALLRHPPFPAHREQMAVAAGLQFLAVNGWQADLDVPRAAVIVIERLASGQLTPAQAASWLVARLSADPSLPAGEGYRRAMLPPGSPVAQIARAVRRQYRRRTRPSPFIIHIGPGDIPGGIITPVTGPMPFTGHASKGAQVLTRLGAGEREVRAAVAELLAESGRERSALPGG